MTIRNEPEYILVQSGLPHLCSKLELFWHTPEFEDIVHQLFLDSRDGTRKGIPMDVSHALVSLVKKNKELVDL